MRENAIVIGVDLNRAGRCYTPTTFQALNHFSFTGPVTPKFGKMGLDTKTPMKAAGQSLVTMTLSSLTYPMLGEHGGAVKHTKQGPGKSSLLRRRKQVAQDPRQPRVWGTGVELDTRRQ